MNLLFLFCNAIAPEKGGIERWTASMTAEFEARGNRCFYLAAKSVWKEFADPERQFFLPNLRKFDVPENHVFFEQFLRDKKISRVIFLWADGKRFPFSKICKKLGVPVISAVHIDPCFYENRFRGNGFLMRLKRFLRFRRQVKIYHWNAQVSDATVLLSERFKDGFLKHFQILGTRERLLRFRILARSRRKPSIFPPRKKNCFLSGAWRF